MFDLGSPGGVLALLAFIWLLPGILMDLVLLGFMFKQLLFDRMSSDLRDDAKLLLAGLVLGFILLPLMIAAPLSGHLARRRARSSRPIGNSADSLEIDK